MPYLICFEKANVALIKDLIASALVIHSAMSVIINLDITLGYVAFVTVLGVITAFLGSYGAIFREQKNLID